MESRESLTRPSVWSVLALGIALLATCAILIVADPFSDTSVLPPCLFHSLTHLYCPGCGTTRALHALIHGEVPLALRMNPLTVTAVPLLPIMLWNASNPGRAWFARISDARLWLPLVLAFVVLRNLPWEPFVWLAPG